jgi:hypothetical protein
LKKLSQNKARPWRWEYIMSHGNKKVMEIHDAQELCITDAVRAAGVPQRGSDHIAGLKSGYALALLAAMHAVSGLVGGDASELADGDSY